MTRPVVVIGGAGPTLGSALCNTFVSGDYQVVALSRGNTPSEKDMPASVHHVSCDLTDGDEVFTKIRDVEESIGHIAAYVHNLGAFAQAPFLESDALQFEQLWKVNCLSAYHAAKAVIAEMVDNSGGSIVFVGATASVKGSAGFAAFAAAKFALRGMAQALAREFGPEGIHIAHVVIDGVMWGDRPRSWGMKQEQCLQPGAVAETIRHLVEQERSAWTHELDIRPDVETF
ncbi:MAG: SDR family NAD(P)-dependent oxidoreductase [Gammaproteobacteria bacterium]|jgi:NAD(P)-dependent dehydrogenase (short-subunit alcohol dehydrogenase family)